MDSFFQLIPITSVSYPFFSIGLCAVAAFSIWPTTRNFRAPYRVAGVVAAVAVLAGALFWGYQTRFAAGEAVPAKPVPTAQVTPVPTTTAPVSAGHDINGQVCGNGAQCIYQAPPAPQKQSGKSPAGNVTSNNQSGGITAGSIGTVNQ